MEWCEDVYFNKSGALEGNKILKVLDKEQYIFIVYILLDQDYLALSICAIKIRVKAAKVGLILSLHWCFWKDIGDCRCLGSYIGIGR